MAEITEFSEINKTSYESQAVASNSPDLNAFNFKNCSKVKNWILVEMKKLRFFCFFGFSFHMMYRLFLYIHGIISSESWTRFHPNYYAHHCTEVHFASFLSGGFITAIVVSSPKRKLAKRTSVHCGMLQISNTVQ